jgi:hypothetical protein
VATTKRGTTAVSRSAGRAVAFAQEGQDRRETPRLRLPRVEAEVVSLGLRVTVLEVGFGGLSIESEHEFEVGEIHDLRSGMSKRNPIVLPARVKHCRLTRATHEPPRYVTGFQFVDGWCPGDRSPVDEFLSQVTKGLATSRRP